ncbi:MAG: 3-dehydroquinate synthase [Tannerella sp.]|jgi:3-dehydroquinate synthase|nr:3-dehydroquinate synthase [Tannerella sp.]
MIVITRDIAATLRSYLSSHRHDKVFVLTDTNSRDKCLPLIDAALTAGGEAGHITIEAGDTHKDIEQVAAVWDVLSKNGASRNSLLVNVGGGMVTDLGGFAGATFKRGLHNLNIPTTLMASVDAAVGGKTGINFNGLKNEIGAFYQPDCVMIDCTFLKTLDRDNLLSGYAEMIKHGLISHRESFDEVLAFDIEREDLDIEKLNDLAGTSVRIKERIVTDDPKESGIRKALNFGHTIGHALESLSFSRRNPLLHGHAVAAGLVSELYLSHKTCAMPVNILRQVTNFIKEHYPAFVFNCDDYDTIYEFMMHDKKNEGGNICFTLLENIGDIRINRIIKKDIVLESLDFYRENMY